MVTNDGEGMYLIRPMQEIRNLAEFSQKSVEEIKELLTNNPSEYNELYKNYREWCLKRFNDSCFNFNEKARKANSSQTSNSDGLTA